MFESLTIIKGFDRGDYVNFNTRTKIFRLNILKRFKCKVRVSFVIYKITINNDKIKMAQKGGRIYLYKK